MKFSKSKIKLRIVTQNGFGEFQENDAHNELKGFVNVYSEKRTKQAIKIHAWVRSLEKKWPIRAQKVTVSGFFLKKLYLHKMQSTFVSQNKMFELLKTPQRNVEFVSELLTNIYVEFFIDSFFLRLSN